MKQSAIMEYYVIKTTKSGVEYKKYKCIDGWSENPKECWRFSESGAKTIAERLNELYGYDKQLYPKKVHFSVLAVDDKSESGDRYGKEADDN